MNNRLSYPFHNRSSFVYVTEKAIHRPAVDAQKCFNMISYFILSVSLHLNAPVNYVGTYGERVSGDPMLIISVCRTWSTSSQLGKPQQNDATLAESLCLLWATWNIQYKYHRHLVTQHLLNIEKSKRSFDISLISFWYFVKCQ